MDNYNRWQGCQVRQVSTGLIYFCYDVHDGMIYLSYRSNFRRLIPFSGIPGNWELLP